MTHLSYALASCAVASRSQNLDKFAVLVGGFDVVGAAFQRCLALANSRCCLTTIWSVLRFNGASPSELAQNHHHRDGPRDDEKQQ